MYQFKAKLDQSSEEIIKTLASLELLVSQAKYSSEVDEKLKQIMKGLCKIRCEWLRLQQYNQSRLRVFSPLAPDFIHFIVKHVKNDGQFFVIKPLYQGFSHLDSIRGYA